MALLFVIIIVIIIVNSHDDDRLMSINQLPRVQRSQTFPPRRMLVFYFSVWVQTIIKGGYPCFIRLCVVIIIPTTFHYPYLATQDYAMGMFQLREEWQKEARGRRMSGVCDGLSQQQAK